MSTGDFHKRRKKRKIDERIKDIESSCRDRAPVPLVRTNTSAIIEPTSTATRLPVRAPQPSSRAHRMSIVIFVEIVRSHDVVAVVKWPKALTKSVENVTLSYLFAGGFVEIGFATPFFLLGGTYLLTMV